MIRKRLLETGCKTLKFWGNLLKFSRSVEHSLRVQRKTWTRQYNDFCGLLYYSIYVTDADGGTHGFPFTHKKEKCFYRRINEKDCECFR